ncbi:DUF1566 domain-containing protein [Desulfobacterales bacterium HSG16]|nr:DUF1566 domain-containing protein [Desulfobacterales bacterium HSG16]
MPCATDDLDHLIINNDGTVTDFHTGLMWQQEIGGEMTWKDALSYCDTLSFSGYSDWRLPTKEELRSIVDYEESYPPINTTYFPSTIHYYPWSSTTNASYTSFAWGMSGYDADDNYEVKSNSNFVRAVRGGQNRLFVSSLNFMEVLKNVELFF